MVAKLDLDGDDVEVIQMTAIQARALDFVSPDTGAEEKLETALDKAQAKVFGGDFKISYLVIEIIE